MSEDRKRYPSQEPNRRINFYMRDTVDPDSDFAALASVLHREGVLGVYNSKGEPNKSAIMQRLIDEKLGRV